MNAVCDINDVDAIRREFQSNGRNVDVANKENKYVGRKAISSPYYKPTKVLKSEQSASVSIFFVCLAFMNIIYK